MLRMRGYGAKMHALPESRGHLDVRRWNTPNRPHLATALIEHGEAPFFEEAGADEPASVRPDDSGDHGAGDQVDAPLSQTSLFEERVAEVHIANPAQAGVEHPKLTRAPRNRIQGPGTRELPGCFSSPPKRPHPLAVHPVDDMQSGIGSGVYNHQMVSHGGNLGWNPQALRAVDFLPLDIDNIRHGGVGEFCLGGCMCCRVTGNGYHSQQGDHRVAPSW